MRKKIDIFGAFEKLENFKKVENPGIRESALLATPANKLGLIVCPKNCTYGGTLVFCHPRFLMSDLPVLLRFALT